MKNPPCNDVCLIGSLAILLLFTPARAQFTTLVEFTGNGATKGSGPNGLVQASDGNFYGTTARGGGNGYGKPTGELIRQAP